MASHYFLTYCNYRYLFDINFAAPFHNPPSLAADNKSGAIESLL